MPPWFEEEIVQQDRPTAWDKWQAIYGWQRQINELKAYPIGGLPATDRAREVMEIHASEMAKAYQALEAWVEVEED